MKLRTYFLLAIVVLATLALAFYLLPSRHRSKSADILLSTAFWQHAVLPGELSQSHAFLEQNCAACHTSVKGVEASRCIVCHADNISVLQRQPSAFHADIGECASCHGEHQGRVASNTKMDHVALAQIGLRQIQTTTPSQDASRAALVAWLAQSKGSPLTPHLQPAESQLNCASCHQTKDRHFGLFGNDCAQCHGTAKWTVPEFRHPSSASQSCAQCHQAPPSHYMMHFKMISMKFARMEKAEVSQCFLCHQTTSWNDIKGAGFYKHH
ncbi:MAG: multiheme c-type cytochrome [Prosthecobacter sp.]